ncbi:DUF262 domain-containing protein [Cesiribacter sp. SM1]|uniref:DUF262 domain-containing protein n=1 Tax=Cesiribacter sp. SM1 TaxID=2861196 RepID=UPI001CD60B3B|nr:DUF262 domain-containing protein [Cesiribacter sp. SM1]
MNAVKLTLADILKIEGNIEHYHIPKYQREYTWGKYNWEVLINDINENDPDYFIGSIIVVNHSDDLRPGEEKIYQVIDGQQRLTTISIVLAAIYYRYKKLQEELEEDDDDEKMDFAIKLNGIKKKLVIRKKQYYSDEQGGFKEGKEMCFLRVQPSSQNNNLQDYKYILAQCGILKEVEYPRNFGNKRFSKAFEYFYSQLPEAKDELDELLNKINRLVFIHISVSSQADAFTLFETLNNRGVPLSPIDIIKNNLLAEMEKQHNQEIDVSYDQWQELLEFVPDYDSQLRFLRQYYNAFKVYDTVRQERISRATRSNILQIYERLIKKDAQKTFDELLDKGAVYGKFSGTNQEANRKVAAMLTELNMVGAAASYTVLLHLFSHRDKLISENTIEEVISFLIKYYVRRNVTDYPSTRDLDGINIEVVEKCHKQLVEEGYISASTVIDAHLNNSKAKPESLQNFQEWLESDMFINNSGMTRYLLWKLDSISHSREYAPDLWKRNPNNGNYVWTIEHVLPQGENLPKKWIEMIADGDKKLAKEIQDEWVHKLGNLTLSAYNSNLSNKSFEEKQSKSQRNILNEEMWIGYKNGLALNKLLFSIDHKNQSLASANTWNADMIEARTNAMVKRIIDIFSFENETVNTVTV